MKNICVIYQFLKFHDVWVLIVRKNWEIWSNFDIYNVFKIMREHPSFHAVEIALTQIESFVHWCTLAHARVRTCVNHSPVYLHILSRAIKRYLQKRKGLHRTVQVCAKQHAKNSILFVWWSILTLSHQKLINLKHFCVNITWYYFFCIFCSENVSALDA